MSAETCRHCGATDDADGDHTCPCPNRDGDCPEHSPPCLTSGCPRPAEVVLVVRTFTDRPTRRERPYCGPCAQERREVFPDRIIDEVTL